MKNHKRQIIYSLIKSMKKLLDIIQSQVDLVKVLKSWQTQLLIVLPASNRFKIILPLCWTARRHFLMVLVSFTAHISSAV